MIELNLRYDGHPRRVRVHVPPAMAVPARLLVLFDGQNVFGDEGSYSGGWHAHAAVDALPSTVRRPIVIGIDHGGRHRIHELWRDLDPFLGFVLGDVIPAVRGLGAVHDGRHGIVIGGSSMGGLAALAALLRHPDVFGGALCMSPSLWATRGSIFHEASAHPPPPKARIYLDVGARERGSMPRLAERMAGFLASNGHPAETMLWRLDRRGIHQERHWRRRLPKALKFLFRRAKK
jgi:enterochelin esterase-like enzyme